MKIHKSLPVYFSYCFNLELEQASKLKFSFVFLNSILNNTYFSITRKD